MNGRQQNQIDVVLVGPSHPRATGGVRETLRSLAGVLERTEGVRFRCQDSGAGRKQNGLKTLASRGQALWRTIRDLNREEVVHFQASFSSILVDALTMLLLSQRARNCIAHVHCPDNAVAMSGFSQRLGWKVLRVAAERLVVIGPGIEEQFKSEWGRRVSTIPNFVRVRDYEEYSFPYERRPKVVIFVGRMTEEKGVFDLLHCAPLLGEQGWRLEFVGSFSDPVEEQVFVETLKTHRNVDWLGRLEGEAKASRLGQARVVALPSRREAFPVVLLEAGASGCAVLSRRVGIVGRLLRDRESGILIGDEEDALASALRAAMLNPALLDRVAKTWHKKVCEEYDEAVVRQKWLNVYQEVSFWQAAKT